MIRYYNTLTLPSGEPCTINEITNEEYLVLVKFMESDNKREVFRILDTIIKETVPSFDGLDIINKAYLYLAFVFYNIKGVVMVNNPNIAEQEVGIETFLNNLEASYNNGASIEVEIKDGLSLVCGYPTDYYIEDDTFQIDYMSSVKEVKQGDTVIRLDAGQRKQLCNSLPTKDQVILTDLVEKNLAQVINIAEGVPLFDMKLNSVSADLFMMIYQVMKERLEDFYSKIYVMVHYAKFSRRDIMEMTPHECQMILNQFIKDKNEQAEKQKEMAQNAPRGNGR